MPWLSAELVSWGCLSFVRPCNRAPSLPIGLQHTWDLPDDEAVSRFYFSRRRNRSYWLLAGLTQWACLYREIRIKFVSGGGKLSLILTSERLRRSMKGELGIRMGLRLETVILDRFRGCCWLFPETDSAFGALHDNSTWNFRREPTFGCLGLPPFFDLYPTRKKARR